MPFECMKLHEVGYQAYPDDHSIYNVYNESTYKRSFPHSRPYRVFAVNFPRNFANFCKSIGSLNAIECMEFACSYQAYVSCMQPSLKGC